MYLQGFMNDWIKKIPKPALEGQRDRWNLFLDGLKIYTTVDSRMQANAEIAVQKHMTKLQAEFFHQNTPQRNPTAPFLELEKTRNRPYYEPGDKGLATLASDEKKKANRKMIFVHHSQKKLK